MEIRIHDKDKLFFIAAIVGFIAFFLPWVGGGWIGQHSGYDLLSYGNQLGEEKILLLVLLPISFSIVALSKTGLFKIVDPSLIKLVEVVPIILIVVFFVKSSSVLGIRLNDIDDIVKGMEGIFKIGFPITLISSIIIVFAPVYHQSSSNQFTRYVSTPTKPFEKDYNVRSLQLAKKVETILNVLFSKLKKIVSWFKANPRKGGIVGLIGLIMVSVYFLFIKNYPTKEGKELALEICNCYEDYSNEVVSTYTDFSNSFDSYSHKRRNDARNKLQNFIDPIDSKRNNCLNNVNTKYESKRIKYINNYEELSRFEESYKSNQNSCISSESDQINALYTNIQTQIETIIDPEPDVQRIKEDLIGKQIPGWNFEYLSEFKDFKVFNSAKGKNRVEYSVQMELYGARDKSKHDCEAIITYNLGYGGWNFNNIKMNYITYTNTFYPEKWSEIRPLKNCRWNAENKYKMAWKTTNWNYARETITGPKLDAKTFPNSNVYYIKSLEDEVIQVKFTYKPNS
jgi:hypothetical protein